VRKTGVGLAVVALLSLGMLGWWGGAELRARGVAAATIEIPPGEALRDTARRLEEAGVVHSGWALRLWARLRGSDRRIAAGRYQLEAGLNAIEVLERLERGDVVMVRRTLPEGLMIEQVAQRLFPDDPGEGRRFVELARNPAAAGLEVPPTGDLEGYLFPDTYTLVDPPSARAALQAILRGGAARTDSLRRVARMRGRDWHQVLTLASIVEGEARVAAERPRIAGVYWNRLRRGMALQADPTVAFATGKIGQRLLYADLRADSPYNTYLHAGLPPGPINSPGLAAIAAALEPEEHDLLYFVHAGDGSHTFSRTLAEHQAAVRAARARR